MLHGTFHTPLVLLSILVATFASYTALSLAERVGRSRGTAVLAWTVGGALAMGSGIWAMHFIGMLAYRLPIPVGYDIPLTLLSLLLPILVSGMALWRVSQPDIDLKELAASGILLGLGINAMHYTGMAALRMDPGITYDPLLFTFSVLIAVVASVGALWIGFQLRHNIPHDWLARSSAALVLGSAIAGMHYTGMAAARFPAGSVCMAASRGVSQDRLAVLVLIAILGILTVALVAAVFDGRLESHLRLLAASQAQAAEGQSQLVREREARSQAESVSAMKDEFLATLSHELRTPLNAVLGWADMLQRGLCDEATVQRGLEVIARNARAQAMLIDDLLDMSRIISGKVRLDVQEVAPAAVVDAAVETVRPAALAKGVVLETRLDPQAGPVAGDPGRLQQVMWNLLSNAVKFTPGGGQVRVTLEQVGSEVVVQVIDSGIGIPASFLPHVFDRFRQADASSTRRHGGLGLGLSIARQLVELHGGAIAVESAGEGQGTTFTVRFPLGQVMQAAVGDAGAGKLGPGAVDPAMAAHDLSGITVLVVDDMADTLELTARMLTARGANPLVAGGAEHALSLLQAARVDVVVSDIAMPGIDGYELVRRMRAQGLCVPVVALTAFTREEDRQRALREGFGAYVRKPLEPAALAAAIAQVLRPAAPASRPEPGCITYPSAARTSDGW
jgi:signal transduction histidine kinase/ActR/RegA family two-component response regulator